MEKQWRPETGFEMPDGSAYEVTAAAAESGGQFVEMQFTLPPGSVSPPPHVHPDLTEEYEVIAGELEVTSDDALRTLGPGDSLSVSPGTIHTFKNRSDAPVRVRNVHRPAARFEDYIEHICRSMRARGIKGTKDPRLPIYLTMLMLEYPDTLAPGRARERVSMCSRAWVASCACGPTRRRDDSSAERLGAGESAQAPADLDRTS